MVFHARLTNVDYGEDQKSPLTKDKIFGKESRFILRFVRLFQNLPSSTKHSINSTNTFVITRLKKSMIQSKRGPFNLPTVKISTACLSKYEQMFQAHLSFATYGRTDMLFIPHRHAKFKKAICVCISNTTPDRFFTKFARQYLITSSVQACLHSCDVVGKLSKV